MWLPTAWGWLAILAIFLATALAWGQWIGVHLAQSAPAAGVDAKGARILVVEGWLTAPELDAAVAVFRRGRYERVVVSGGPFEDWPAEPRFDTHAARAADYLKHHGLADATVDAVPAPASAQDRTFLSAVVIREWAKQRGIRLDAIDLFSAGVHAYRSALVFRMALG
ncbi:MAG: YdcF family protein, partial [Pseudomonadota bacterium]|nr:YdcF family protein [Pseudomonadota bacterium]